MLRVSDDVRDYVKNKGGVVTISHGCDAGMCCGRINLGPTVRLGKPDNLEDFNEYLLNGISVFVPLNFISPYSLKIVLGKLLWFNTLHIEGWKLV
ncbi:CC/Se motif family (seleno)protein [Dendrosporobacter sp. 1207_IL3150]|uniref:CC/Se motif family (seleno)protein n=1 Tax=Dendrosporobacter sp. 1207_IL3150 TaxID=3084054 RepID=UPI002FD8B30C